MKVKDCSFVVVLFCILGCASKGLIAGRIRLKLSDGDFLYLNGKYMYLINGAERIDSVLVNDKLVILDPNKANISYHEVYSVQIWDEFDGQKYLRPIGFESTLTGKSIIHSFFLVEDNDIEIEPYLGRFDKDKKSSFKGVDRNEVIFKMVSLAATDSRHSDERSLIIEINKRTIKQYSRSGFLLNLLYGYRAQFTVDELKAQVAAFERTKETLPLIELLQAYYPYAGNMNKVYPTGLQVIGSKGQVQSLIPKNNYQVLIFWASWCGPCRAEIPSLKALYNKYQQKGLSITSISIDKKNEDWQKALQQERMPWPQYLSNGPHRDQLDRFFTVTAIPKTVLFAPDGKLLEMYEGYPNRLGEVLDSIYTK